MDLLLFILAAFAGLVGLEGAHQPDHAVDFLDAEVAGALRHGGAEGDVRPLLRPLQADPHRLRAHGHDDRVFAVEHQHAVLAKDTGLGAGIGLHAAVPVEVILADVEHDRGGWLETACGIQLEAGEFQHPDFGQRVRHEVLGQGVQQGRADVAGNRHRFARMGDQLTGQ